MGYKWRQTKGWVDCRPEQYRHSGIFPKPASICSLKCMYHILCDMELKHMTLGEKIKRIRLVLQRPFHIFSYLPNDEEIMLILEGSEESIPRLSFRGKSMVGAVTAAEEYIEKEKKMGSLKIADEEEEEPKV